MRGTYFQLEVGFHTMYATVAATQFAMSVFRPMAGAQRRLIADAVKAKPVSGLASFGDMEFSCEGLW